MSQKFLKSKSHSQPFSNKRNKKIPTEIPMKILANSHKTA